MKSLESTFIYRNLNKSNSITNNVMKLMKNGQVLTSNNLDESLMIINKNFKFPFKYKVMEAFNKGIIRIIYSDSAILPTCMPFFLTKTSSGDIVGVVVANIYGHMDKDTGFVKIDPKKLYCAMEAAYIARLCFINSKQLANKSNIITMGSNIYSLMFSRVLNKKFALNIDKNKFHKIIMLSSKFFMINMLEMADTELTFNYAIKNCPNGNLYILQDTNELFPTESFNDLETFINTLVSPKLGLNLKGLTVQNYLESFISMYESSALLALESFPYFMYNVLSVINGGYINNQYIMEDIVGSNGAKLYNAILTLDK